VNSTRIRHIFWDWNGTLLDDAWLCRDVMNAMLRNRNMPELSAERYQEIFDFPIEGYYQRIGFDFERESFADLGREFIDGYELRRMEARLYADATEALRKVADWGVGQSVLSAYQHDTLVTLIAEHGLTDFFSALHGHQDIYPVGKTPQGRDALRTLGLDPAETLLIGDTVHDAEVAEELGIGVLLIPGGNQPEARLRAAGVPLFADRTQALEWIKTQVFTKRG